MGWPRVRLTVGNAMAAMATFAVFLGLLRPLGGLGLAILGAGAAGAVLAWGALRGDRGLAGRVLGWATLVTTGVVGWVSILFFVGGISTYWILIGAAGLLLLGVSAMLGSGAAWASAASRPGADRRWPAWLAWPIVVVMTALPVSIPQSKWPLHLAFRASRPWLDRLADRIATGAPVSFPARAGLFVVVESATDPGTRNIGLVTDARPGGLSGLVRVERPGDGRTMGPFNNLNWDVDLGAGWRCQVTD